MPSALTLSNSSMRSCLGLVLRPALLQLVHVDVFHQALLGEQHRPLGGAADADAEHAGRAPAGAHRRHRLQDPVDQAVARIHHRRTSTCSRCRRPWRRRYVDGVAGNQRHLDHGRRVVLGVLPLEVRVGDDRRAQRVVGVEVALADAVVDGVLDAAGEALEADVHADLQEDVDDAGVLADRPPALGAHLRVGQDLGDRVLRRRALLELVGARQVGDVVGRVVEADVLQRRGDAVDEIGVADVVVVMCRTRLRADGPGSCVTRVATVPASESRVRARPGNADAKPCCVATASTAFSATIRGRSRCRRIRITRPALPSA